MPLERLTMLVVPVDGDATLVVPRLEAPRVVEHPDRFALRGRMLENLDHHHLARPGAAAPRPNASRRLPIAPRSRRLAWSHLLTRIRRVRIRE
jgi:hypothetical protein